MFERKKKPQNGASNIKRFTLCTIASTQTHTKVVVVGSTKNNFYCSPAHKILQHKKCFKPTHNSQDFMRICSCYSKIYFLPRVASNKIQTLNEPYKVERAPTAKRKTHKGEDQRRSEKNLYAKKFEQRRKYFHLLSSLCGMALKLGF